MLDKNMLHEVPEVVHRAVLDALDSLNEYDVANENVFFASRKIKEKNTKSRMPRVAVIILVCLCVCGTTVVAMEMVNAYRQRMENMNKMLLEKYYSITMAFDTINLSRPYTNEEEARYDKLSKEYEEKGVFPESQLTYLQNVDDYNGKGVALDSTSGTLYLPEGILSDEELLEIIDFQHKTDYSLYKHNEKWLADESAWENRMSAMDTEMVDRIYLAFFSSDGWLNGCHCRPLTEDESRRYEELNRYYEEDGRFPNSEPTIIQTPEEYVGEGIAICSADSTYYFPEHKLSDEELLQIIDYDHKSKYSISRINKEIELGFRTGYPQH